jgi:hypothetical protein
MNEIYETTVDCANEIERRFDSDDWDFWEAMADFCTIRELIAAQRRDMEVRNGK